MNPHHLEGDSHETDVKTKRRWNQLRIWHLFVLMTLVVVACTLVRHVSAVRDFRNAKAAFYDAIERDDLSKVQRLLRRYPSLIRTNSPTLRVPGDLSIYTYGETPVSVAVMYESQETFGYLVSRCPDLDAAGEANCPPLIHAVCAADIHYLEVLLNKGADTSVRDHTGKTASDYATQFKRDDYFDLIASRR